MDVLEFITKQFGWGPFTIVLALLGIGARLGAKLQKFVDAAEHAADSLSKLEKSNSEDHRVFYSRTDELRSDVSVIQGQLKK